MPRTALVWFRRDLRLADNPALCAALAEADAIVPVYVHSPEEEAPWAPGAASHWWLHHSLAALDRELRDRGSRLCIRRGPALPALLELARECGANAVHWNRLYEPARGRARHRAEDRAAGARARGEQQQRRAAG